MKSFARFLLFLLFVLVVFSGFLFTVNNTSPISLWFGTTLAPQPLGVWVLLGFTGGALSGLLLGFGLWRRVQLRLQIGVLRQRLLQAEKELARLRVQPGSAAGNGKPDA